MTAGVAGGCVAAVEVLVLAGGRSQRWAPTWPLIPPASMQAAGRHDADDRPFVNASENPAPSQNSATSRPGWSSPSRPIQDNGCSWRTRHRGTRPRPAAPVSDRDRAELPAAESLGDRREHLAIADADDQAVIRIGAGHPRVRTAFARLPESAAAALVLALPAIWSATTVPTELGHPKARLYRIGYTGDG
jgi:hypothetical protein